MRGVQILPVQQDPRDDEVSFWKQRPLTGWIQVLSDEKGGGYLLVFTVFINTWGCAHIIQADIRTSAVTQALNIKLNTGQYWGVLTP